MGKYTWPFTIGAKCNIKSLTSCNLWTQNSVLSKIKHAADILWTYTGMLYPLKIICNPRKVCETTPFGFKAWFVKSTLCIGKNYVKIKNSTILSNCPGFVTPRANNRPKYIMYLPTVKYQSSETLYVHISSDTAAYFYKRSAVIKEQLIKFITQC